MGAVLLEFVEKRNLKGYNTFRNFRQVSITSHAHIGNCKEILDSSVGAIFAHTA
jgi:hypothetical protein